MRKGVPAQERRSLSERGHGWSGLAKSFQAAGMFVVLEAGDSFHPGAASWGSPGGGLHFFLEENTGSMIQKVTKNLSTKRQNKEPTACSRTVRGKTDPEFSADNFLLEGVRALSAVCAE